MELQEEVLLDYYEELIKSLGKELPRTETEQALKNALAARPDAIPDMKEGECPRCRYKHYMIQLLMAPVAEKLKIEPKSLTDAQHDAVMYMVHLMWGFDGVYERIAATPCHSEQERQPLLAKLGPNGEQLQIITGGQAGSPVHGLLGMIEEAIKEGSAQFENEADKAGAKKRKLPKAKAAVRPAAKRAAKKRAQKHLP